MTPSRCLVGTRVGEVEILTRCVSKGLPKAVVANAASSYDNHRVRQIEGGLASLEAKDISTVPILTCDSEETAIPLGGRASKKKLETLAQICSGETPFHD